MRMVVLLLLMASVLTGCQTSPFGSRSSDTAPTVQDPLDSATLPPVDASDSLEPVNTPVEPAPASAPPAEGVEAPIPDEKGLAMSQDQRFSDIPLPVQVRPVPERTFVYESGTLQVGRMVYSSRAAVAELAQFYIQALPAADWTRKNLTETDKVHMVFNKPGKRLEVDIIEQGVGRNRLLIVTLYPEDANGGGL